MKNTEKENFNALTGLRFFAALAVVLYHFAGPIAKNTTYFVSSLVESGFIAVSFFYVLSGFVLSYSYVDRKGVMRGTRRSFWIARFARVYPAYLLAFLLAAPFNILWSLRVNHVGIGIVKLMSGAALVLTMQQSWTPWTAWYWNFPAWSVSAETFFYFMFPFAALLLKRFSGKACFIAMGVLWLLALVPPISLHVLQGSMTSASANTTANRWQMAVEFTPLLRLPEFLIGMLLGRVYVLGLRLPARASQLLAYISLLALPFCVMYGSALPRPVLANGLFVPLFVMVIYSLAENRGWLSRGLSLPIFLVLGEASYGIYILQIPVSYLLRQPPPYHSATLLCIYLAVLIIVALLSWRFVESPLRSRIRKLFTKLESQTASPHQMVHSVRTGTGITESSLASSRDKLGDVSIRNGIAHTVANES